jgi:hypothetical protein
MLESSKWTRREGEGPAFCKREESRRKATRIIAVPPMRNWTGESLLWSQSMGISILSATMLVLRSISVTVTVWDGG